MVTRRCVQRGCCPGNLGAGEAWALPRSLTRGCRLRVGNPESRVRPWARADHHARDWEQTDVVDCHVPLHSGSPSASHFRASRTISSSCDHSIAYKKYLITRVKALSPSLRFNYAPHSHCVTSTHLSASSLRRILIRTMPSQ
jgi:hypothetical protein